MKPSDRNNNFVVAIAHVDGKRMDKGIGVSEDDIFDVFGKEMSTQTSTDASLFSPRPRRPSPNRKETLTQCGPTTIITVQEPSESEDQGKKRDISVVHEVPKKITSWEDLEIVDKASLFYLKSGVSFH
jgi:hypothetical protein